MTEEGQVAEEVQPVPDMGESSGGVDGGASGGDGVSHETAGADGDNDGVESSDAGTPAEPAPDPFSRRFAQLAREQKKLRQERDEMKRVQQELDARKGTVSSFDDLQKLARENPYEVMQKLGLDYEALSRQVLQDGEITPEQKMAGEMKRLRDEIDAMKAERAELVKQEEAKKYQDTYGRFVDEIKSFVDNTNEFDFVKANNAYHVVAEVMQEHYNSTQDVMSYDDAAKMVEDYYEAEAEKYLAVPKLEQRLKERYAPAKTEPVAGQAEEEAQASEKRPPKTLTNTQVQRAPGDKPKKLSKQQSIDLLANKYGASLFRQG
jgi:multidrug efflux pump subunit AcrB